MCTDDIYRDFVMASHVSGHNDSVRECRFELEDGLTIVGWRLRVESSNASVPPMRVLCTHGWQDNSASFKPIIQALTQRQLIPPAQTQQSSEDHHITTILPSKQQPPSSTWSSADVPMDILSIDLCGHGQSGHLPLTAYYSVPVYALQLCLVLDQLGWRDDLGCHILAHSMGGAVAILMAVTLPQHIRSIILLDSVGPISHREAQLVRSLRRHDQLNINRAHAAQKDHKLYATIDDCTDRYVANIKYISRASAALLTQRGTKRSSDGKFYFSRDSRVKPTTLQTATEAQVTAVFAAVKCPILVILAEDTERRKVFELLQQLLADSQDRDDCMRRMQQLKPKGALAAFAAIPNRFKQIEDVTIVSVANSHHHLHMDYPDIVVQPIRQFYQRMLTNKPDQTDTTTKSNTNNNMTSDNRSKL